MEKNFNKFVLYIDSTQKTINFDSLSKLNEYVCNLTGVSQKQVKIDELKLSLGENTDVCVYSKLGQPIRTIGFAYRTYWK